MAQIPIPLKIVEKTIAIENNECIASPPGFGEAARFWLWLGCVSFGGPAAQISLMQAELVEKRRWISQPSFNQGLSFCTLLPGPEAQQLATWIGLQLHGVKGALFAGISFLLPAALLLWILSYGYFAFAHLPGVGSLVFGLKCAVLVLIAHALSRFAKRSLQTPLAWGFALLCFACLALGYSYFIAIGTAALVAALFGSEKTPPKATQSAFATDADAQSAAHPNCAKAVFFTGIGAAALLVLLLIWVQQAGSPMLQELSSLMTKAALITIGGAYAVLPFVFGQATQFGWLDAKQAMAGLALAESTPGPLVIVLGFVGFAVGWHFSGGQNRLAAATIGYCVALLCTFLPSFALVLCGSLALTQISRWRRVRLAMEGISQAVIGGIAWLALSFTIALIWPTAGVYLPNLPALALVALLFGLQHRYQFSSAKLVVAGVVISGLFGAIYSARFALGA